MKHYKQKTLVQEIDTLKYTGRDVFDNPENQNFPHENFPHVSINGADSDIRESNFIVSCLFLVC